MWRSLSHISFWAVFSLLFLYQNPGATLQDYVSWLMILGVAAVVVYTNLYVLLPAYFFKKHYFRYALLLLALVGVGAVMLKAFIPSHKDTLNSSIFQNGINLFFFVVITSSLKFFREVVSKQERLIKAENERLKAELSLLKAQVNPHFLFNTLNNLYGLILQNQNRQAAEITLGLSDLMRYLLESSKTEKVSLKREIQFIQDYLTLEKIRLTHQADIRFEVSGLKDDLFISPLLFIPLVENAFKHGLQSLSENSFAHFSLAIQGAEIFFEAQNSIGESIAPQPKSETGLANLSKRLQLLFPQNHLFEIVSKDGIFKVTLNIKL